MWLLHSILTSEADFRMNYKGRDSVSSGVYVTNGSESEEGYSYEKHNVC